MKATAKSDLFLSVIESNKGIIYKVANSYCNVVEERKDLVQEIIVQLWKSFEQYDDRYQYSTWIYRIALNVSISFYRKETRRKKVSTPLSNEILKVADDINEADENMILLQQFISELKELDKALVILYLEEKSHREIAEIVGISETNVATKIGRIKILLKQKFTNRWLSAKKTFSKWKI